MVYTRRLLLTRVVGVASVWLFDDVELVYMRLPRMEGPRERPEWGDVRAGGCQDNVWHALDDWWVTPDHRRLVVAPSGFETFWAPLDPQVCDRFDLKMSDLNLDLGPLGTLLPTDGD